jgi:hypothetical protein
MTVSHPITNKVRRIALRVGKTGKKPIFGPKFEVPADMLAGFTCNGAVPLTMMFLSETSGGELHWSQELYDNRKAIAQDVIANGTERVYDTDPHLAATLRRHPVAGADVLVIGSVHPFYEAMVDLFGGRPSTVEYRKIHHQIADLKTYTVAEFEGLGLTYDAAVSISSIEHDGLGRYGDPIDPDGDLKAMQKCKSYLKKDGLLYLAVPVGRDVVCWNAHRVYGRIRLPRLLAGWEVVDSSGFSPDLFDHGQLGDFKQPVFVLRNL